MGRGFTLLKRALLLLGIWLLASVQLYQAAAQALEHRRLTGEVAQLQTEYDERLDGYAELLAQGERIRNDEQAQIELLKGRLGYTEPDETPIVILTQP